MAPASLRQGLSARSDGCSHAPGSLQPLQRLRQWGVTTGSAPRQRAVSVRALGSVAMPVVTEVAKRALAVSASGSLASNSAAQCELGFTARGILIHCVCSAWIPANCCADDSLRMHTSHH